MKLLEKLCLTSAVAGREHRMRKLIREQTQGLFDSVTEDALGSLICLRKARPPRGTKRKPKRDATKVMIAAHMDQIGFMVKHVDDSGFIRVVSVGGFDPRNLFARLCTICPDPRDPAKDLPAVMNPGGKPVHIASPEDRKKVPDIEDLMLDTGLPGNLVKKKVKIGDMVVLRAPFERIGDAVVSQCLDNRVACWIAIRVMQKLKTHTCDVYCCFTTQEEVGLRGAGTAAFGIEPDIGIALDTTLCVDTPGVSMDLAVTGFGNGAALTAMDQGSIADYDLLEEFERIAKRRKIKFQRSILPRGATDAGTIQRAARGARTFTLSCPTRYIHTVTEMTHEDDLHACRDVLAAYIAQTK